MMSSRHLVKGSLYWVVFPFLLLLLCQSVWADDSDGTIPILDENGDSVYVPDGRRPSLYTRDFTNCTGNSSINLTRFDAAFYSDNMTAVFNFEGRTSIPNDTVMLYIGVFAYGESRYELVFNPCSANISSLCPMNHSVPIATNVFLVLSEAGLSGISSLAYSTPDLESQVYIRFFSNSTQSQIGCYVSAVTNGVTFSHENASGAILIIFLLFNVASSLALAIYGDNVDSNRIHFAHGPSVFAIFAVFHHIYYTGALSLNWPSVLVAFWSNYAWFAGMIYSEGMQNSISRFASDKTDRTPAFGAGATGASPGWLGSEFDISDIYKRSLEALPSMHDTSNWHGSLARPDLVMLGTYPGFAGTLSHANIPLSNAFLTGLVWFSVALIIMSVLIGLIKSTMEVLVHFDLIRADRLGNFRIHWKVYAVSVVGRTVFIGFFMLMFLALFQFALGGSSGVGGVATVLFILLFSGIMIMAAWPFYYRATPGAPLWKRDRVFLQKRPGIFPPYSLVKTSSVEALEEPSRIVGSFTWWSLRCTDPNLDGRPIHTDIYFIAKFGWLSARYRADCWWFSGLWLVYQFTHACILSGAATHPAAQVFFLLVLEVVAVGFMIWIKPFESKRLNVVMVYILGFSKVSVLVLSAMLLPEYNHGRTTAAVIGIVIIVIQAVLTISLLLSIVIGAITTFMSLNRYREGPTEHPGFRRMQAAYFDHLEIASTEIRPPPPSPPMTPPSRRDPYFYVSSVTRHPRIVEEEDNNIPLSTVDTQRSGTPRPSSPHPQAWRRSPHCSERRYGGIDLREMGMVGRNSPEHNNGLAN